MRSERLIVLKLGGSILRGDDGLARAIDEIARWREAGHSVVGVVSALAGETERLIARARVLGGESPEEGATAALVATGELASASMLALGLARAGIGASVLDAPAIDLRTAGSTLDATPVGVDTARVRGALDAGRVAIVPGFVGRDGNASATLLGRGGSDLTALFLGARLGARCRLVKDVDGLYQRDPAGGGDGPGRRYATLDWAAALLLCTGAPGRGGAGAGGAGGGGEAGVVQAKAVRLAWRHRLEFEVGAPGRADATRVGDLPVTFSPAAPPNPQPRWIADVPASNSAP